MRAVRAGAARIWEIKGVHPPRRWVKPFAFFSSLFDINHARKVFADGCWADEGARVPLRLGFGDIGGMTGRYWANNQIWDKGEGRARGW